MLYWKIKNCNKKRRLSSTMCGSYIQLSSLLTKKKGFWGPSSLNSHTWPQLPSYALAFPVARGSNYIKITPVLSERLIWKAKISRALFSRHVWNIDFNSDRRRCVLLQTLRQCSECFVGLVSCKANVTWWTVLCCHCCCLQMRIFHCELFACGVHRRCRCTKVCRCKRKVCMIGEVSKSTASKTALVKKHHVPLSTLCNIVKNKEKIFFAYSKTNSAKHTRLRLLTYADV